MELQKGLSMVWVVAKKAKTNFGTILCKKRCFESWQAARVYQQDLWNQGVIADMWEERDGQHSNFTTRHLS